MRIDYNEPKKSYTSPQAIGNRTRKESSSPLMLAVVITGIVCLAIGFGSGWLLSQRYTKKGFLAAMEQQSLENSPQPAAAPPTAPPIAPQATAPPQPSQPNGTTPPAATQPAPETPFSFYKNLPSGQKSTVLGSGINATANTNMKQPLQAAIPSNLSKSAHPQTAPTPAAAKPVAPAPPEKAAARPETESFTVQIASYGLKSEADTMKSKLASKGYSAYVVESNQGDKGIWYRVRVGKKLEQEAAKELAAKLGKGAIPIPDKE